MKRRSGRNYIDLDPFKDELIKRYQRGGATQADLADWLKTRGVNTSPSTIHSRLQEWGIHKGPSTALSHANGSMSPPAPERKLAPMIERNPPSALAQPRRSNLYQISSTARWAHTPSNLTLLWLAISLPLVIWDAGYVFLRPHSMPGGALHSPLWVPYALYGTIDYIYGWPAWEQHNGFTAAQTFLNVAETVVYIAYLYLVWQYGQVVEEKGRGAPRQLGTLTKARRVAGRVGAWAVLLGFGAAMVTFSKTVLYWLNEVCGGFDNIGHNDTYTLIFLWIIPNGAWLLLPLYMIYVFGREILQGLETATGR